MRTVSFNEGGQDHPKLIFYKNRHVLKDHRKIRQNKHFHPENGWFRSDSSQGLVLPRPSWWLNLMVEPPILKNMIVKLDQYISPGRVEHKE